MVGGGAPGSPSSSIGLGFNLLGSGLPTRSIP
jgi:hypothetical protein